MLVEHSFHVVAVRIQQIRRVVAGVVARPLARGPVVAPTRGQATGVVKAGSLEGSGVDPARAMVDLMASMRSMEATQRAITTIDQTLQQTSSQVGNLPG